MLLSSEKKKMLLELFSVATGSRRIGESLLYLVECILGVDGNDWYLSINGVRSSKLMNIVVDWKDVDIGKLAEVVYAKKNKIPVRRLVEMKWLNVSKDDLYGIYHYLKKLKKVMMFE